MSLRRAAHVRASVLALVCAVTACDRGCERGCARDLVDRALPRDPSPNAGGAGPGSVADAPCPGDVVRCTAGTVYAMGPRSASCRSPEGCPCSWEPLGPCREGCVVDGLEMTLDRSRARAQLCNEGRPLVAPLVAPIERPIPAPTGPHGPAGQAGQAGAQGQGIADDELPCDVERYRCDRGIVSRCSSSTTATQRSEPVPIARCVDGCAEDGALVTADVDPSHARALLCRRSAAPP